MTSIAIPFRLSRLALTSLSLASLPLTAFAAPLAPNVPNAGQLLQQVQPPPSQAEPNANPGLTIGQPGSTAPADTTPIPVSHIELTGNTVFSSAILHPLVADGEGKTLTLAQLDALARRIADYYHAHGYPLAQAVIPPQTLNGGTVRITIIEARYGQVKAENHSRVSERLVNATLAPLQAGTPVEQSQLDQRLLLLGDLPGVNSHAVLGPGATPGTSDLTAEIDPGPWYSGVVSVDDEGDRYTGRVRGNATLALNNPLHQGDVFSLSGQTTGRDLDYGQLSYQLTLNGLGTQAGASYSALHYILGDSMAALDAHGTAQQVSAWLAQPFIRSPEFNLNGRLEFDHKQLDDEIDSASVRDDRHITSAMASLEADRRDTLLAGGFTRATLGVTQGVLAWDNAAAQAADAATADTQGGYTQWTLGLTRLQGLTDATRLYLAFSYQHSSRNVDSSEQWLLGGPGSVRGYPVSALGGASGYVATVELRHDFALPVIGKVQGEAFVDSGELTIDEDPWEAGTNHAHLTGVGVGLDWSGPHQWVAKVQVATPVGSTPELAGERPSVQVWAQLAKGF